LPPSGSSQKPRIGFNTHASPGGTLKAAKQFLGIFPETRNERIFDHAESSYTCSITQKHLQSIYTRKGAPLTWFPLLKSGYLRASLDHQWSPFDSPPNQYLCYTQPHVSPL